MTTDYLTAEERDAQLAESMRLAFEIADEAARVDIESACVAHHEGGHEWCLTRLSNDHDVYDVMQVDRAVRYLTLRGKLERHASQPALVRCTN